MTPEETQPFQIKESYTVEGITANFVWYESTIIREGLVTTMNRFEKVVSVMEARHKEHLKMLGDLLDENRTLKRELAVLKAPK